MISLTREELLTFKAFFAPLDAVI